VGRQAGGGRSGASRADFEGGTYQGTLNAVTDLGIVASLSTDARSETEERERFYPWSAVLSVDLSG
jgi:hypothetical protein